MLKIILFSIALNFPAIFLAADVSIQRKNLDYRTGIMLRSILTLSTGNDVTSEESHALLQEVFHTLLQHRTDIHKKTVLPNTPVVQKHKLIVTLISRPGQDIKPPLQRPVSLPAPRREPRDTGL